MWCTDPPPLLDWFTIWGSRCRPNSGHLVAPTPSSSPLFHLSQLPSEIKFRLILNLKSVQRTETNENQKQNIFVEKYGMKNVGLFEEWIKFLFWREKLEGVCPRESAAWLLRDSMMVDTPLISSSSCSSSRDLGWRPEGPGERGAEVKHWTRSTTAHYKIGGSLKKYYKTSQELKMLSSVTFIPFLSLCFCFGLNFGWRLHTL